MAGEITFVPQVEDQVAVARGSLRHSVRRRRFIVRVAVLLAFGGGIGAAIQLLDGGAGTGWIAFGVGTAAAWLVVILLGLYLLIPRRVARLFHQQRSLDRVFTFGWNETGILFRSDTSRSELAWDAYHHWFEDDRIFAFGLNEQLFHWAPKRVMVADQIADLRAAVMASGLPHA